MDGAGTIIIVMLRGLSSSLSASLVSIGFQQAFKSDRVTEK